MHREENNTVIIRKEKLYKAHYQVLLNRNAFIFIGAGCLLGLFGSNDGINPWLGLIVVTLISALFVGTVAWVVHLIAKHRNKEDKIYPYEELCSKLDSDILTNATIQECLDAVNGLT